MKRLTILILTLLFLCGCTSSTSFRKAEGKYYTRGEIITDDGHVWSFDSKEAAYDGQDVTVIFNDNGTPWNVTDDEIFAITIP